MGIGMHSSMSSTVDSLCIPKEESIDQLIDNVIKCTPVEAVTSPIKVFRREHHPTGGLEIDTLFTSLPSSSPKMKASAILTMIGFYNLPGLFCWDLENSLTALGYLKGLYAL